MTTSIWRYSHLTLAISSSIFVLIAAVTGIVLTFEPISKQLSEYSIPNTENITLAETISELQKQYDEVISITVDENDFVTASVITKEGKSATFYVNPFTGEKLGEPEKKHPVFQFATSLHRSLFLKSTGRFIIGFVSFLLSLIAISLLATNDVTSRFEGPAIGPRDNATPTDGAMRAMVTRKGATTYPRGPILEYLCAVVFGSIAGTPKKD